MKSPGSITLCTRPNVSGSFSLTQASLDAVKLPGEFRRAPRHLPSPMSLKAFSPYGTALESHQMMEGLSGCIFPSTHTRPCIWYEIPIAAISAGAGQDDRTSAVACLRFSHHSRGSCSAHPACFETIGISCFGQNAEATHFPVSESTRLAFTEELPMS